MKLLLPLLLLSSPAASEVFLLSTHGSWEVSFVSASGSMPDYCSAGAHVPYASFSLDYRLDEGLRGWVIQQSAPWTTKGPGTLMIWSDIDLQPWQVTVEFYWDSASFLLAGDANLERFLTELSRASILYIDYNVMGGNGPAPDVTFPLNGAAAAINALAECVEKLGVPL